MEKQRIFSPYAICLKYENANKLWRIDGKIFPIFYLHKKITCEAGRRLHNTQYVSAYGIHAFYLCST